MTLLGSMRTGLSRLRSSMAGERRVFVEYKAYQPGKVDRTDMDFSPVMVGPKSPRASATLANAKPPCFRRAVRVGMGCRAGLSLRSGSRHWHPATRYPAAYAVGKFGVTQTVRPSRGLPEQVRHVLHHVGLLA